MLLQNNPRKFPRMFHKYPWGHDDRTVDLSQRFERLVSSHPEHTLKPNYDGGRRRALRQGAK